MFNRSVITIPCFVLPNGNKGDAGSLRFMFDHKTIISTLFGSHDFQNHFEYERQFKCERTGEEHITYHFKSTDTKIKRDLTVRDYTTRIVIHESVGSAYAGSSNSVTVTSKKNIDILAAWLKTIQENVT